MNDIRVASRYAKSLLQLTLELNVIEDTYKDMELVANTCNNSKELVSLLKSPIIKSDKKQAIISEIFDKNVGEVTRKFLNLIISSKREGILGQIAKQFILQYKSNKNIEVVHVTTATPMSDAIRKQIPSIVQEAIGSKADIEFVEEVDKNLIGGIVLRLGDKQIDSSIKRRLLDLEREFSKNPYIKKY